MIFLGKYETGAKAALPVFKKFIKNVVKKKEALPFKIPKSINLVMVDVETGLPPSKDSKKIIYESFKPEDSYITELEKSYNTDRLEIYDSEKEIKIFRFY